MSLLFGKRPTEARSISGDAFIRGDDVLSGTTLRDKALRLTPVYAAVSLLADGVASLPLQAYRMAPDGTRQRTDAPSLFRNPSANGTTYDWIHSAMVSLLLRGNAYGLVTGWSGGYPSTVEWLHPDRVQVDEVTRPGVATYFVNGRQVDRTDIVHIAGFTQPGSCVGLSPIECYAMTLDMGLSAQKSARDWFKNGTTPAVDITMNNIVDLSPSVVQAVKDRYASTTRAGDPFVHGDNMSLSAIGVSAADAQLLDAITASATHIAAIYHVAPEDIGGERGSSLTYSTTELDEIKFQSRSLRPWVTRLEQVFGTITPRPIYMRFNFDANIRTEVKARWETHQIALATSAVTINEIRAIEDRPPVPWGDAPYVSPSSLPAAPPEPSPRSEPDVHVHVSTPPVDARVTFERGAISVPVEVDARTEPHVDATSHFTDGAFVNNIDARTTVEPPEVAVTIPPAPLVRKRIETDPESGRITAVVEERDE